MPKGDEIRFRMGVMLSARVRRAVLKMQCDPLQHPSDGDLRGAVFQRKMLERGLEEIEEHYKLRELTSKEALDLLREAKTPASE